MEAAIKSQDVPVLLQVMLLGKNWKYEELASKLTLSTSILHRSLHRCSQAKLIADSQTKLFTANLLEFLIHGVKYAFAAQAGETIRGIPTAHSAPPLKQQIVAGQDVYVWPDSEGKVKGQAIEPLHPLVPKIAIQNTQLYEMLALIDAIRVGKPREVALATKLLTERINTYGQQFNQ